MFALLKRWGRDAKDRRKAADWKKPLRWNKEVSEAGKRYMIFPSMCDWLDNEVPIEWLADFLKLIHDTPNLDWLLLTKRPENWKKRLRECWRFFQGESSMSNFIEHWLGGGSLIPQNVWIGVSVEDQKRADERIPLLLKIPAKIRFLSVEPLLESIAFDDEWFSRKLGTNTGIHWGIVGGESGGVRRDCGVDAICAVARQFVATDTPCHVKQDCAFKPGQQGRIPEEIWKLKQFPKVTL